MAVDVDPEEPAGLTALSRLAEAQAGVVTVGQLSVLGVSRSQLRSRLRREWRYVLPRVVALTGAPLNEQQRYVAALLYAGRDAALASLTAAAWHGVKAARVDHMVRVIVPIDRCVIDQSFVVVRRTTRADEGRWVRGPLTLCRPARSVADAAREAGGDQARAIVIEAVQKRLVGLHHVRHELLAGPTRGAGDLRRAIEEAERGAWSIPEADLARLVTTSRVLPPMLANPVLEIGQVRLPTPDGWFDDVALAVQVHSRRFHSGYLDWEATVSSDGVFAEHGVPLVTVTPRQIALDSAAVLRRIELAHASARLRPRPAVRATARASAA
jgi:hypothetical protein